MLALTAYAVLLLHMHSYTDYIYIGTFFFFHIENGMLPGGKAAKMNHFNIMIQHGKKLFHNLTIKV